MQAVKVALVFVGLMLLMGAPALADEVGHRSYEMPRSVVVPVTDSKSDRQYELYIRLPEGYGVGEEADMLHPVIYTTDAKWHMEMVAGSAEYLMPDAIVVGISWQTDLGADRPDRSRYRDFIFPCEASTEERPREADTHLAFIRNDVIPYVEAQYRADPKGRAYFGYSLGAGFGAYVLLAQPDTFQSYILGSPVTMTGSESHLYALEAERVAAGQNLQANVFLSYGELERETIVDLTSTLATKLAGRTQGTMPLKGPIVIEGANHGTAFPLTVVRGVTWLSNLGAK